MIEIAHKTFHLRFLAPCGVKRTERMHFMMDPQEVFDEKGRRDAERSSAPRERVRYEPHYVPTPSGVALQTVRAMGKLDRETVGRILGMGEIQIRWIEEGEADFDNDADARQALALVALGRPA